MNAWQWAGTVAGGAFGVFTAVLFGVALAGRHEERRRKQRWNADVCRALARYAAYQTIKHGADREFAEAVLADIRALPETSERP